MNIIAAIENTVSISLFNKGLAGKIFSDVKQSGAKVVLKNNAPECVLISPQEYVKLIDEINDAQLLYTAAQRMQSYNPETAIPNEEIQKSLGVTDDELEAMDEVEFE